MLFQSIQTCYLPNIKAAFFELFISSSSPSLIYTRFVSHQLTSAFVVRDAVRLKSTPTTLKQRKYMMNASLDGPWFHRRGWIETDKTRVQEYEDPGCEVDQKDAVNLDSSSQTDSVCMAFSILHRSRCVSVAVLQCCTAGEEDRPRSPRDPCVLVGSRSDLIGLSAAASPATTTHINTHVYAAALGFGLCLVRRSSVRSQDLVKETAHTQ